MVFMSKATFLSDIRKQRLALISKMHLNTGFYHNEQTKRLAIVVHLETAGGAMQRRLRVEIYFGVT